MTIHECICCIICARCRLGSLLPRLCRFHRETAQLYAPQFRQITLWWWEIIVDAACATPQFWKNVSTLNLKTFVYGRQHTTNFSLRFFRMEMYCVSDVFRNVKPCVWNVLAWTAKRVASEPHARYLWVYFMATIHKTMNRDTEKKLKRHLDFQAENNKLLF